MTSAVEREATSQRLRALAVERFERSTDVPTRFVHEHAGLIARACAEMAGRFQRGGRLIAVGIGAAVTDARHVTVEFVHPVIVGKRALPALLLGGGELGEDSAGRPLELLGRPSDIALVIAANDARELTRFVERAQKAGMLTIALTGVGGQSPPADFVFDVPVSDPLIVQEVHELLYHILWELVHVFLEHREA